MTDYDDEYEPKDRQQLKLEAAAAQALGDAIIALSAPHFEALITKLDLPDKLCDTLVACRSVKAHEGRRRQLQFMGKLMRDVDPAPIQQMLAEFKRGGDVAAKQTQNVERWRERLLAEGDVALKELLQLYPNANAARLKSLIANARKESADQQAPRAARTLFKVLRELVKE